MRRSLLAITALALSAPALALDAGYYELQSPQIRELSDSPAGGHGDMRGNSDAFGGHGDMRGGHGDMRSTDGLSIGDLPTELDIVDLALDKIINMGKKVWTIVEAGRPVVNIKTDSANALPQGALNWNQLEGWKMPKTKLYEASYKNGYNAEVVNFKFRVLYTYGGNVKGQGAYLTNVTVIPADVSVAWGFKLDVETSVPSVVNAGSSTQPVGAMELLVKWTVSTALQHVEHSQSFYVRGDGQFSDLDVSN